MVDEMISDEMWELMGFIKISAIRLKTLKALDTKHLMPTEIAKITEHRPTEISNALRQLKSRNLVECKNENAKKG